MVIAQSITALPPPRGLAISETPMRSKSTLRQRGQANECYPRDNALPLPAQRIVKCTGSARSRALHTARLRAIMVRSHPVSELPDCNQTAGNPPSQPDSRCSAVYHSWGEQCSSAIFSSPRSARAHCGKRKSSACSFLKECDEIAISSGD